MTRSLRFHNPRTGVEVKHYDEEYGEGLQIEVKDNDSVAYLDFRRELAEQLLEKLAAAMAIVLAREESSK